MRERVSAVSSRASAASPCHPERAQRVEGSALSALSIGLFNHGTRINCRIYRKSRIAPCGRRDLSSCHQGFEVVDDEERCTGASKSTQRGAIRPFPSDRRSRSAFRRSDPVGASTRSADRRPREIEGSALTQSQHFPLRSKCRPPDSLRSDRRDAVPHPLIPADHATRDCVCHSITLANSASQLVGADRLALARQRAARLPADARLRRVVGGDRDHRDTVREHPPCGAAPRGRSSRACACRAARSRGSRR